MRGRLTICLRSLAKKTAPVVLENTAKSILMSHAIVMW